MRHGKVGLQLGHHQKYYISRCEEKQSIQLTITVKGNDGTSVEERRELIDDVTQLLDHIMKVFMREVKKPILMVPCPLCPILHITLSEISTSGTVFCPQSNDAPLRSADQLSVYCDQLTPEQTALFSAILAQKPEMWELINIVIPKIKAKWQDVAYCMRYEVYEVDAIATELHDLKEQCVKLFTNWLNTSHSPTPKTWQTLLEHLKRVDELTAAVEQIEKELISSQLVHNGTANQKREPSVDITAPRQASSSWLGSCNIS